MGVAPLPLYSLLCIAERKLTDESAHRPSNPPTKRPNIGSERRLAPNKRLVITLQLKRICQSPKTPREPLHASSSINRLLLAEEDANMAPRLDGEAHAPREQIPNFTNLLLVERDSWVDGEAEDVYRGIWVGGQYGPCVL